eukprot:m.407501 g.407501  ORF g.407501 m.407501 type:complete len:122 (+) comp56505_c0_seq34:325-690(+)
MIVSLGSKINLHRKVGQLLECILALLCDLHHGPCLHELDSASTAGLEDNRQRAFRREAHDSASLNAKHANNVVPNKMQGHSSSAIAAKKDIPSTLKLEDLLSEALSLGSPRTKRVINRRTS